MKPFPSFDDLRQAFILAKVHQNIYVVIIFEKTVKSDNILINQLLMYLYLLHQLLLAALLDQVLLINDLRCIYLARVLLLKDVAASKPSFPHKLTLYVVSSVNQLSSFTIVYELFDSASDALGTTSKWIRGGSITGTMTWNCTFPRNNYLIIRGWLLVKAHRRYARCGQFRAYLALGQWVFVVLIVIIIDVCGTIDTRELPKKVH